MPALTIPQPPADARRPSVRPVRRIAAIRLGFVPLVDAAPLIVAEALGYFEKAGLRVVLGAELGWGSIREKIVYHELDAAHAPAGLLFSILCGSHARPCPVRGDLILNEQGNAITLSRRLWEKGARDAESLRVLLRGGASRKPVFAVVSPFSTHNMLLRDWLFRAGIDPDHDVRIAVLPPPLVGEHMEEGQIDGFCVGEPWNSAAALAGEGWIAATSAELAPRHPEKVLLVTEKLLNERAEEYATLRQAILAACRFCDIPENRPRVVDILHERRLFPVKREVLANSLIGPFKTGVGTVVAKQPFLSFARGDSNRASRNKAEWFLDGVLESGALCLDPTRRRTCLEAFHDSPIGK